MKNVVVYNGLAYIGYRIGRGHFTFIHLVDKELNFAKWLSKDVINSFYIIVLPCKYSLK